MAVKQLKKLINKNPIRKAHITLQYQAVKKQTNQIHKIIRIVQFTEHENHITAGGCKKKIQS